METGIELIAQERKEQIEKHGRTVEKDMQINTDGQLCHAASGLLRTEGEESAMDIILGFGKLHNWDISIIEKMDAKPYKERLIIAGALIAAEIDRVNSTNQ